MTPNYRKKRPAQGPNKNQLKSSRSEKQQKQAANAGTLSERFPTVKRLQVDLRIEAATGAVLEQTSRQIEPRAPLLLDVSCPGGCANGMFPLTEVVESVLQNNLETREGMGICQAGSFQDPKLPCSTKLYYRLQVNY